MKKRNTKQFDEAEIESEENVLGQPDELKEIFIPNPDEHDFLFYHSPDFKFLYVAALGEKTTPVTIKHAFPNAINVSAKEFDRLYRLKTKAKVITIGDDTFIDEHFPK